MLMVDEPKVEPNLPRAGVQSPDGGGIQSVARASRLLAAAAEHRDGATVKQLAFRCGIAVPTAYHLVNTLLEQRLLERDAARRLRLGPQVALLARAYCAQHQR